VVAVSFGLLAAWFYTGNPHSDGNNLDWAHSADGRPSGSSLQAVEQVNGHLDWPIG
jgi:hypothetical protein